MKKVRFLSALMAVCMMLSLLPVSALAAEAEHAPTCGYVCTHAHDEDCGYYVHNMQTEPCGHTDDCGYVAADVYGVCDCAAEADEEGNVVHTDACASLTVATAAAPCAHADGHETEVTSEDTSACTHTCGDDEWACADGCPVYTAANDVQLMAETVEDDAAKAAEFEVQVANLLVTLQGQYIYVAPHTTNVKNVVKSFESLTPEQQALVGEETKIALAAAQKASENNYSYNNPNEILSFGTNNGPVLDLGEVEYGTTFSMLKDQLPTKIFAIKSYRFYQYDLKAISGQNSWDTSKFNPNTSGQQEIPVVEAYFTKGSGTDIVALPVGGKVLVALGEKPAASSELSLNIFDGNIAVTDGGESYTVIQEGGKAYDLLKEGTLTINHAGWTDKYNPQSRNIKVGAEVALNLVLDSLNIIGDSGNREVSALDIGTGAQVNLTLVGANTLKSGAAASGINVGQGATLVIDGAGSLKAQSSGDGAGIGFYDWKLLRNGENIWFNVVGNNGFFDASKPNYWVDPSYDPDTTLGIDYPTIHIKSGTVYAASGGGAGIGGGVGFSGGTIIIEEAANVTVRAGSGGSLPYGAGIGGGTYGNGGSITINGATVYALAQDSAAAIGGGKGGSAGTIILEGGADVTAVGGWKNYAIGGGLDSRDTSGSLSVSSDVTLRAYAEGRSSKAVSVAPGNEDLFIYTPVAYTFAINPNLNLAGDASILNGRFAELVYQYDRHQNKVPNVIYVEPIGAPDQAIRLELPHSYSDGQSVVQQRAYQAFATTVSLIDGQATDFMVRSGNPDDTEGMYAKYSLEDSDTQLLFTVAPSSMTSRDDLNWSYIITATAGSNGAVSDSGMSAVDKDADKTYTFTPADGYVVDTVTVDSQTVTVTGNTYTFKNVTAHHTITVSFKTAPVTPPVDPGTPGVTTYTITVKYVKLNGESLADSYTTHKNSGASYDVSAQAAKAIEGYTVDHADGAVKGTLRGDVTVTVYYKQNVTDVPDEPETEIPGEEPPLTDLPEVEIPGEDTPLAPLPEEEGDVVIVDPETPLGSLPQTGTGRSVDPAVTLGLLALTGSLAMAGLTVGMKKRKDGEAAE